MRRRRLAEAGLRLLGSVEGQRLDLGALSQKAVELAEIMLPLSDCHITPSYQKRAHKLAQMMEDPQGQALTTLLTDRAHRCQDAGTTLEHVRYLTQSLGGPQFLGIWERAQMGLLNLGRVMAPEVTRRALLDQIRQEATGLIRSSSPEGLTQYLQTRKRQGVAVNVNHLGEEVLGEEEAKRRVDGYIALLKQPGVHTISVKISSICSQLDVLAFDDSVTAICERLRPIYAAALSAGSRDHSSLVYLDMEAHRDLSLTLEAFQRLLDEPRFLKLSAGIALQAYLPDSHAAQDQLLTWAHRRKQRGGSPIRMRLVKGANLATETVTANQRGWPLPVFGSKHEVDASYKRMMLRGCAPEQTSNVQLGIATHNLFDLCLGLVLRSSSGTSRGVEFELLDGMAEPLLGALLDLQAPVLVYTPIVDSDEFPSAVAYLVRRLDENTSPENYLRHSFSIRVGNVAWGEQKQRFEAACQTVSSTQTQRQGDLHQPTGATSIAERFRNVADTDFSVPENRRATRSALDALDAGDRPTLHSAIPGTSPESQRSYPGFDPSRPSSVPYRYGLASAEQIDAALRNADTARVDWTATPLSERQQTLLHAAAALRAHRFELIALMVQDAGKRAAEADTEVSEAIDFAEYYARSAEEVWTSANSAGIDVKPIGPTVITPPWNFPLAIPLGGVFAALVMGNPVILKPALETPRVAYRAAELCWEAGVPLAVLQLVLCADEVATQLITDSRTRAVVLTGASATARLFHKFRPNLHLLAETGGKNALYVSPLSDREQAVQDITTSAFAHAGQKCSALSQLILHREVYNDAGFRDLLADAACSLKVGSAWDFSVRVTPLIQPPNDLQHRALSKLSDGESWLVKPRIGDSNTRQVSPGVKWGVKPGSHSHVTEFFCPLLAVLEARDLDDALRVANATPYGLTSGIHSLDEREQRRWMEGIHAGNVYVNRKITGSIVQRQPFGGWKDSGFGPGAKAGGPNYAAQFVSLEPARSRPRLAPTTSGPGPAGMPMRRQRLRQLVAALPVPLDALVAQWSDTYFADYVRYFSQPQDHSNVLGEKNLLRYVPLDGLLVLVPETAPAPEVSEQTLRVLVAALCAGTEPRLCVHSSSADLPKLRPVLEALGGTPFKTLSELDANLDHVERIRVLGSPGPELYSLAAQRGIHVESAPPLECGRFELLRYLREQSLCITVHRYGNLSPTLLQSI